MAQSAEYELEDAAMKFARWQSQPRSFAGNVAAFEALKTAALNYSASQAAKENSGRQEIDAPATHVAEEAEQGCTGVISWSTKYEAWLEFQIEHGHAPDGYRVEMTPEYALGRQTAFLAALAYFRQEFGHTSDECS